MKQVKSESSAFYYLNVFLGESDGNWAIVGNELLLDNIIFDHMKIYKEDSFGVASDRKTHPDDSGQLLVAYYIYDTHPITKSSKQLFITKRWLVGWLKIESCFYCRIIKTHEEYFQKYISSNYLDVC